MSIVVTITCDKCHERVAAVSRVKLRFGREAGHKGQLDLCSDCAEDLILQPMGLVQGKLPFGDAPEPAGGMTTHGAERKARASSFDAKA